MPVIEKAVKFEDFLKSPALEGASAAIACCQAPGERTPAVQWIGKTGERIVVLIGPEGDFSFAEVSAAIAAGCTPVDLGPSVLRTETAALGVIFLVAFK